MRLNSISETQIIENDSIQRVSKNIAKFTSLGSSSFLLHETIMVDISKTIVSFLNIVYFELFKLGNLTTSFFNGLFSLKGL